MGPVSWLHISDYHAGQPDGHDEDLVRQPLLDDIERTLLEAKVYPDFLFFTGDAIYGATSDAPPLAEQFEAALDYINEVSKRIGVETSNVFLIPGNHDVNRRKVSEIGRTFFRDSRTQGGMAAGGIDRILRNASSHDSEHIFACLSEYREHVYQAFPHLKTDHLLGAYSIGRETAAGILVSITGWNSAWTAYGKDPSGRNDYGQLHAAAKYQHQISKDDSLSTSNTSEIELRILLMHHHPRWLVEHEALDTEKLIERRFDVFLHGHEHEARDQPIQGRVVTLGGLAAYDSMTKQVGYRFAEYDACMAELVETTRFLDRGTDTFATRDSGVYSLAPPSSRKPKRHFQVPEKSAITRRISALSGESRTVGRDSEVQGGINALGHRRVFVIVGPPGPGQNTCCKGHCSARLR